MVTKYFRILCDYCSIKLLKVDSARKNFINFYHPRPQASLHGINALLLANICDISFEY